ncbi:DUF3108 domain-containing protein [Thioalkalivibrio sp. HK1]|uniref:DUF3108 domain-containing protein n=1 Tax=Thioalkalivibrio sp. HK1 TaxID=1469245 RepID=UPI0004B6F488|nr:DUF3108 domain-containing protein [Thioalkalivibrio sp. HK1]
MPTIRFLDPSSFFHRSARCLIEAVLICLIATASAAGYDFGDFRLPEPFDATFSLESGGNRIGKTHWSSGEEGGRYIFQSHTESVGIMSLIYGGEIAERSEWSEYEGDWHPIEYHYHRTGFKEREIHIRFERDKGIARLQSPKGPWKLEVPEGVNDKLGYLLALMHDLSEGKKDLRYPIADGGRVRSYLFDIQGTERIESAIGPLETVVVKRIRENEGEKKRETTIWCAPDLGFLPVKIEHRERGSPMISLLIEGIEGFGQRFEP